MRAVIQRVNSASVEVDGKLVSSIDKGLLVLVGIEKEDTSRDSEYLIRKILNLRIFDDQEKFLDKSVQDLGLQVLLVSQFTLYGSCKKGNRPSFDKAMPPKEAKVFYSDFVEKFKQSYSKVKDGIFGAYMQVSLVNDGPVTIVLDSCR
jgi:D-tyrosyl-tRNA(Tyr) deacylase